MFYQRLLFSLCSPLCAICFAVIVAKAVWSNARIESGYRSMARQAMQSGELDKAKFYYSRLIGGRKSIEPQDRLNWCLLQLSLGRVSEARALLREMAPENKLGFGPAHRLMAKFVRAEYAANPSPEVLERWQWHLRGGVQDESTESHQMWASYLFQIGKPKETLARLVAAADRENRLSLEVGLIAKRLGEKDVCAKQLEKSRRYAEGIIEKDAHDVKAWILLIRTLAAEENFEQAEKVSVKAITVASDPQLMRIVSDLQLLIFDRVGVEDVAQKFARLANASKMDRNNPAIYQRFITLYQDCGSEEDKAMLRQTLQTTIASGRETAFAHFALGSMYYMEEDSEKALFHVEQAYQQVPQMFDVANNMAWLLANGPNKDLEKAERLIRSVLDKVPNGVQYRDTLASILEGKGAWKEAVAELEWVLGNSASKEKKNVHRRLELVYSQLGNEDMARLHRELAAEGPK